EDYESRKVFLSAFIVKECSRRVSNWRSQLSLPELLEAQGVIGLEGIDTRALVKHIREAGAMKAVVSTEVLDAMDLVRMAGQSEGLLGRDLVREVTCEAAYDWDEPLADVEPKEPQFDIVVMDYGVKYNILRLLVTHGCRVHVVPAYTKAADILARNPDGIFLSNGPGDPAALPGIVAEVRAMLGQRPLFGICLGHQILGQAMGGTTSKLKFGHHGGNQPVMHLKDRHVEISAQNHGFVVDMESLPAGTVEVTHMNLNDNTVEGLRCLETPSFSVQYHPEAAPGPHDSRYLFEMFTELMAAAR
ncbi:MAG: glutamine-hydrolyzing carbamoyl-phosphate synthase small subunit, partial [Planctomycetes bacterium]|nr:glutamine-hydrolyzing carbamoyl-phosphate synthase small subunit [Planctomycetota bacterium]